MEVTNISTEHAHVIAVAAWVRNTFIQLPYATVRGNHRKRFRHDALNVVLAHTVVDHAGTTRFVHSYDLFDLAFDIAFASYRLRDLSYRLAIECFVGPITRYHRI